VLNLVVNARDAMPNGGDIRISTSRWDVTAAAPGAPVPGVYLRVRVKDTGHGMPANVLQMVFGSEFTTKGENGTGLGLPQVRAFMRLSGGHVDAASEPGIGTSVDLLFPSVQPDGSLHSSPPRSSIPIHGSPRARDRLIAADAMTTW
jgi:signal transduction histidine kinase